MNSTIKVGLAVFAIVAAVGLFAASTVVYTAEAVPCPNSIKNPDHIQCLPDKAKAPSQVPKP